MVLTGNNMGSSEIWDKYHSCCIGNLSPFPIQHSWYLPQISLLPMLLLVQIYVQRGAKLRTSDFQNSQADIL